MHCATILALVVISLCGSEVIAVEHNGQQHSSSTNGATTDGNPDGHTDEQLQRKKFVEETKKDGDQKSYLGLGTLLSAPIPHPTIEEHLAQLTEALKIKYADGFMDNPNPKDHGTVLEETSKHIRDQNTAKTAANSMGIATLVSDIAAAKDGTGHETHKTTGVETRRS
ncbi:hypothetical protein Ddc_16959 [Ditylenchus destructor]|nr:hypothetical protein Ddc_16959 [Ditylenchus destructor]